MFNFGICYPVHIYLQKISPSPQKKISNINNPQKILNINNEEQIKCLHIVYSEF